MTDKTDVGQNCDGSLSQLFVNDIEALIAIETLRQNFQQKTSYMRITYFIFSFLSLTHKLYLYICLTVSRGIKKVRWLRKSCDSESVTILSQLFDICLGFDFAGFFDVRCDKILANTDSSTARTLYAHSWHANTATIDY